MEMFLTSRAVVTVVKRALKVIVEANGDIWNAFEEELSLLVNVLLWRLRAGQVACQAPIVRCSTWSQLGAENALGGHQS